MKKMILLILSVLIIILAIGLAQKDARTDKTDVQTDSHHLFASWETLEYDKCVSIWLIKRFVDTEAEFVFHPRETEIQGGVVFDVPGAAWSRQHRKCTSDCILETLILDDPAVEAIVAMAHNVELNFWQLDSFPDAQKSFQEVMAMTQKESGNEECVAEIVRYFDRIYLSLSENKQE